VRLRAVRRAAPLRRPRDRDVAVTATDLCGNKGVLSEAVQITNTQLATQREVAEHQRTKDSQGRIDAG
jgi:hypothetical protein